MNDRLIISLTSPVLAAVPASRVRALGKNKERHKPLRAKTMPHRPGTTESRCGIEPHGPTVRHLVVSLSLHSDSFADGFRILREAQLQNATAITGLDLVRIGSQRQRHRPLELAFSIRIAFAFLLLALLLFLGTDRQPIAAYLDVEVVSLEASARTTISFPVSS